MITAIMTIVALYIGGKIEDSIRNSDHKFPIDYPDFD